MKAGEALRLKRAGRFEIVAARLWNVLNEGKPFTPVFVLGTLLLLGLPHLTDGGYWLRQLVALFALAPLFLVFYRYAFPLRLRAALSVLLAVAMVGFRAFDAAAIALVLALFFGFTVVLWGASTTTCASARRGETAALLAARP